MKYFCPVCAFTAMPYAPIPYNICPCCGTEFGVDDHVASYPELRSLWISQGMPWFDDITLPPVGWNPSIQLFRAEFGASLPTFGRFTVTGDRSEDVQADVAARELVFEAHAA